MAYVFVVHLTVMAKALCIYHCLCLAVYILPQQIVQMRMTVDCIMTRPRS